MGKDQLKSLLEKQAVLRICTSGCICRREMEGTPWDHWSEGKRKIRVHWEDSKEGNLCAVLRSPFIVESSKLEVLQRGAVKMRGVSERRAGALRGERQDNPVYPYIKGCCKDKRVRPIIFSHWQRLFKENGFWGPARKIIEKLQWNL